MRGPGALWLLAGIAYLACETAAAAAFPGYSYARDFISDLGVPYDVFAGGRLMRSPLAAVMNLGGFVLDGILFGAAAILAARAAGPMGRTGAAFVALALVHSAGLILVGTIHAGPREAAAGIGHLHVVGAAMAIVGGNAALIAAAAAARAFAAAPAYRKLSGGLGLSGLAGVAMLELHRSAGLALLPPGILERWSVYPITAWELVTGVILLTRRANGGGG